MRQKDTFWQDWQLGKLPAQLAHPAPFSTYPDTQVEHVDPFEHVKQFAMAEQFWQVACPVRKKPIWQILQAVASTQLAQFATKKLQHTVWEIVQFRQLAPER